MKLTLLIQIYFTLVIFSLMDRVFGHHSKVHIRKSKIGGKLKCGISTCKPNGDDRKAKSILGFNRTFIIYSRASGDTGLPSTGLTHSEEFQKHHGYFGRDRNGILEYANSFLRYVEQNYGINFPVPNEDDLINEKTILSKGLMWKRFVDPLGEFQLMFESNGEDVVTYANPPPCSVGGYILQFLNDYKLSDCQGVIPAGSSLLYIDVICNTTKYCGLEDQISFTLIPERPVMHNLVNSKIVSKKYGEGVLIYPKGAFVDGVEFGILVARFPAV
ncbi:unnamed protein product [Owenia fusiformis]|nr:unnamed protein product [Owenia fusiformis]